MTEDGANGPARNERGIVETVVGDIAMRRAVPNVFLLDETGRLTAWPVGAPDGVPASLGPLIDMYFAQGAAHRGALTELVEIDGMQMSVRIIPYHVQSPSQYALIVEPFVVRTPHAQGSGELTAT